MKYIFVKFIYSFVQFLEIECYVSYNIYDLFMKYIFGGIENSMKMNRYVILLRWW